MGRDDPYANRAAERQVKIPLVQGEKNFQTCLRVAEPKPNDERESLLKDLNQCVEYRKTIEFFIKTKGLHGYFERNGGSLEKGIANANRSMDEKLKSDRDYTYSELGRMMKELKDWD